MQSLLDEMQQCKSVKACIELALTDAYGEYEQASAWLTCIEEMFGRFDRVKLMDEEVTLQGFYLENGLTVVAICRKGKQRARVALESLEFRTSRRLKPAGSRHLYQAAACPNVIRPSALQSL